MGRPLMDRPTKEGLGASDVPGIAGASPWVTPAAIWLDRMELVAPQPESAAMRAGKQFERSILALTADQTGDTIYANRLQFRHPDWPTVPLWATPDGFTRPRRALVEVKMVGHRFADWTDGVPAYVNLQVQAQLACLPRVRQAIVAALVGGELRVFRVDRQPDIQAALPGLVSVWWQRHVVGERAPDPEGPGDQWALLRALATVEGRPERLATADEAHWAAALLKAQSQTDDLAAEADALRLSLADAARDSDLVGVGWKARWGTRRTVDWGAVVAEEGIPQIVLDRHTRTTPMFTFRRAGRQSALEEQPA